MSNVGMKKNEMKKSNETKSKKSIFEVEIQTFFEINLK